MKIGVMLRHYEQQEGGVKHYTKTILPLLFTMGSQHEYVLIYQNPKLVGTYASYPNVREIVATMPGTVTWDQIAVPWVTRGLGLDLIFNPKFTVPVFTRAKTVFVLHGSEWFEIPTHFKWWDRLYFERSTSIYANSADAFIAVARAVKNDAVRHMGIDANKVFPVHNAIKATQFHFVSDTALLDRVRAKYKLPEKYILWVGQIESRKNIRRLLQAFAKIAPDVPHTLVFAGERRWNAPGELEPIETLGLKDRILFTDWIAHDELPAVYRMADLFAFPSLYEGFGIPLVEAMACGCPIVTATTCAPPEVCKDAAVYVDPLDVDAIAAAMRRVLGDADLRRQMVERGLVRARDFSWEKCVREILSVFDYAVNPALPRPATGEG